jgi:hypothetical protein
MTIDTYKLLDRKMKEIEEALSVMRWNYIHNSAGVKEWALKSCDGIRDELKRHRLCNYAALSWEDSEKIDAENKPKEMTGSGAFGATWTGD